MFCITILAPSPPAFAPKSVFRSPTIPRYDVKRRWSGNSENQRLRIKRMRLIKFQTGQICRARCCQYAHIKIFDNGPLTQNLLCIYCVFTVGWHELPPKTYRSLRTQRLDFSHTHTRPARPTTRPEWTGYLTAR